MCAPGSLALGVLQSVLLSVSASLGRSKQAATSRASLADSMIQAAGKLDAVRVSRSLPQYVPLGRRARVRVP